jgi:hypothetical protein
LQAACVLYAKSLEEANIKMDPEEIGYDGVE